MPSTQIALTDNDTDDSDTDDPAPIESTDYTTLAPTDQRGGDGCCPWCLSSAETFEHHDNGTVGCSHCGAAIPTDADWYERGEKIVI
jgi:hypothetical protein